ncbi:MAG TPA: SLC13 family permease [Acidimicrobiales bacterium]|nr:SLC13 family permease [Acidimicrobiales bacterium]
MTAAGPGDGPPRWASWAVLAVGLPALVVAVLADPAGAGEAANQDWTPFVLVTGLLLLGLVVGDDGLFDAGGRLMARLGRGGWSLFAAAAVLVAAVTAVLNLDTAVTFLTPVLVVAARRRQVDELPFLYLAVFLANGASLLLPGSNLTNLIVLGHRHLSGGAFAATMFPAFLAASVAVPVVLAAIFWRRLQRTRSPATRSVAGTGPSGGPGAGPPGGPAGSTAVLATARPRLGLGLAGAVVAVGAAVALGGTALAVVVAAAGVVAAGCRIAQRRLSVGAVGRTVDVPVLVGLFGLAVALGTLGRAWSGPQWVLAHAASWEQAAVGAASSVLVNNLPAASLLAARRPPDPQALLVGLNLGPNLAVTGSLSAVLWLQAARPLGARTSAGRYTALGLVVVPVSMAAALGALALFG